MVTSEIRSDIETIEKNADLKVETNFNSRVEALEYIEFNIIDRIEGLLLQSIVPPEELMPLKQVAEGVKAQLEDIDEVLFQRLRAELRAGGCTGTALLDRIVEYVAPGSNGSLGQDEAGYDNLDLLINGILLRQALPVPTKVREAGMLYYQQTPARIIFELIEKAHFSGQDVFYDLGSGLGQVSILANLVSGVITKGLEVEPAYCDYARACAADLNLGGVEFLNVDARSADFSTGTVFFMYTPFEGGILQEVLGKLRLESRMRRITLFSYGPVTPDVARQSWLKSMDQNGDQIYKLARFENL
jgi:hypothetical protein